MKILFTGGGGAGNEAIWKLLCNRYDLHFGDADQDAISLSIPSKHRHTLPYACDDNFISKIAEICGELKIDLLVPGVDEELLQLCLNREEKNVPKIFAPSANFIALMLDKLRCFEFLMQSELSVPETFLVDQAERLHFPMIVKPRWGRGSRGVCIVRSITEIEAYKILYKPAPESLIVQELVNGIEYTVLVAGDKEGRLKAVVPVKVICKKGITIRAKTEGNLAIFDYAKKFQDIFKVSGVYNIQCIVNSRGKVLPFEVNPRISTTLCLSIASGFDPFKEEEYTQSVFFPTSDLHLKRNWLNDIYRI